MVRDPEIPGDPADPVTSGICGEENLLSATVFRETGENLSSERLR